MKQPAALPASACAFRAALLRWFDAHKRSLPWRGAPSPYAVLVSELMLQQTTVAAVIPFYERWMKRFPTAASLARAEDQDVLRHWAGLGYYSRARNLHRAARRISEQHGGRVPRDMEALRALPGVGGYTAAAVASMAFGAPAPAIDANAIRVYSRLGAVPGNPASARVRKHLEQFANTLIDPARAGDFNQAVMELGALICPPRAPDCAACPVMAFCEARRLGRQTAYPHKTAKPGTVRVDAACALLIRNGAALLRRRPENGPLAGLWEPPCLDVPPHGAPGQTAERAALDQSGVRCISEQQLFTINHTFTNHRITLRVMACRALARARISRAHADHAVWAAGADIRDYPLTSAALKLFTKAGFMEQSAAGDSNPRCRE